MKIIWESRYVRVCSLEDLGTGCSLVFKDTYAEVAARNYRYNILPHGYTISNLFSKEEALQIAQQISSAAGQIKQGTFRLSPERAIELYNGNEQNLEVIPLEKISF